MDPNWAAEHLQVIRTLMERAAVYRRALAPVMVFVGVMGAAGAVGGWLFQIESLRGFAVYWMSIAVAALAGAFLLIRRQAIRDREPFWSLPTRRVTQAVLPPLVAGLATCLVVLGSNGHLAEPLAGAVGTWLPLGWVVLYGCALHAAGFFMPRGVKLFGWLILLGGCALLAAGVPDGMSPRTYGHGVMGAFFGVLHLAYGVYLYSTEKRKNEA